MAEQRARAAGAEGELTYIGAGAEGIVFCDERARAYKVGRWGEGRLRDEARWFKTAASLPAIRAYVPRFVKYDRTHDVIVRECVQPREDRATPWQQRSKKRDASVVHERITRAMKPYGFGPPEFKDDAYVNTKRGPVLVDMGFALHRGRPLVEDALDIVNGRTNAGLQDVRDMTWSLRMERGETIPAPVANKLLKRLQAIEPSVEL